MLELIFFPVRHHSPACAWHVARIIASRRPCAVLIEGPRDATPLIADLAGMQTCAPVAIYTTFIDKANALQRDKHDAANPARFAAYYPLADFSPELVAARAAVAAGIAVRFIDLTFPELILAEQHDPASPDAATKPNLRSLFDEYALRHSKLLQALCERTGARDIDDLWDHLFETDFTTVSDDEFIRRVETYCGLARADYTPDMLSVEGNTAREAAMASEIVAAQEEFAAQSAPILVVTGGFHTPGLRELLANSPKRKAPRKHGGDTQVFLLRYGFAQLDRLNGYASGMPSPEFYQRTWDSLAASTPEDTGANDRVAAQIIVELGRRARDKGYGISTADEIAALAQARALATYRGHSRLTREDMLDGIRPAFVKGAMDAEGALVMNLAREFLAGDRIGELPPGVAIAPLVADFRAQAVRHRLDLDTLNPREVSLDLMRDRSVSHRQLSRMFFRLAYLTVPFATHVAGPDYVNGRDLARVQEVWRYRWSPDTESALVTASVYGATLEEASAAKLQADRLAASQGARRADAAAGLLLHACRMGLHRFAPDLLAHTVGLIAEDSVFVSLVQTAEQLVLLHLSREPLEAHDLSGVLDAAVAAYRRACYLLPALAGVTEADAEGGVIDAMNALTQVALSLGQSGDATAAAEPLHQLRRTGLRALLDDVAANAAVSGAAAGGLFADGDVSSEELVRLVTGRMEFAIEALDGAATGGKPQPRSGPAFLRGLLRVNRSCVWQAPELLAELNRIVVGWPMDAFVRVLPDLRLAFADLTAREADMVARRVAALTGARVTPSLVIRDADERDLILGAQLDQRITELMAGDGLGDWLQSGATPSLREAP